MDSILAEVESLQVREVVLIAQDLAAYGRDAGVGDQVDRAAGAGDLGARRLGPAPLPVPVRADRSADRADGRRSGAVLRPLVAARLGAARSSHAPLGQRRQVPGAHRADPFAARADAAFRSNFIVGYPGETEADHDELLAFVEAAQLDWCGFFSYSVEEGTYAAELDGQVPEGLVDDRLAELRALQDDISAARRDELIGTEITVLVDEPGVARSHREAPEIDGIVVVPDELSVGEFHRVVVHGAEGPDLHAALPSPVATGAP